MTALVALMLVNANSNLVYAMPKEPGVVPYGVGIADIAQNECKIIVYGTGGVAGVGTLAIGIAATGGIGLLVGAAGVAIGSLVGYFTDQGCSEVEAKKLDELASAYYNAYLRAEEGQGSPGWHDNEVHVWANVFIQDFQRGTNESGELRGDGWGAIISEGFGAEYPPEYVGGGFWDAYERAVNGPNALDTPLYPGYPTSQEHVWPGSTIRIQDFQGGSWGDAAIIGTDEEAWLVAGGHWEAYWRNNGQIDLRNPLGQLYVDDEGWYTQDFEGGQIQELNGEFKVELNGAGEAAPAEIPPVGHEEPESPPIQQIEPDNAQDEPEVTEPEAPQEDAPVDEPTSPPVDNSEQPPADQGDPVVPAEPDSESCSNPELPVLTSLAAYGDGNHSTSEPVQITFQVDNSGCEDYGTVEMRLVDQAPDGQTHVLYSSEFEFFPEGGGGAGVNADLGQVGEHKIWVELDNGSGWQRVVNDSEVEDPTIDEPDLGDWHVDGYLYITVSDAGSGETSDRGETIDGGSTDLTQFTDMCHYYWDGGWVENTCNYSGSTDMGEFLDEPLMDGCNYLYDGSYFYQNYDYGC